MVRRLFFDIETAPCIGYFWRPGHNISISHENIIQESAIICICYKWEGKDKIHSLTWDKGDDSDMLRTFSRIAMSADEVIGHNSDKFDIRWIRGRCMLHGIPFPSGMVSFDTCKTARSNMALNSYRLDYIGKFLGYGGKKETGGFGLWKDVMAGSKKALKDMVEYCKRDIDLLEKVHTHILNYAPVSTHVGVIGGGYKHHCPRCGSSRTKISKQRVTAAGTPKVQIVCHDCSGYHTITQSVYLSNAKKEDKELRASRIEELAEVVRDKRKEKKK